MEYANKFLDGWTLVHIGAGVALGLFKVPRRWAYPLIIGYEIVENVIMRESMGDFFKEVEGPRNAVSDVVFGIGGYEATNYVMNS